MTSEYRIKKKRYLIVAGLAAALLSSVVIAGSQLQKSSAQTVEPGFDLFDSSAVVMLEVVPDSGRSLTIPVMLSGPTIVERMAVTPDGVIPTEIVELSLVSVDPVGITDGVFTTDPLGIPDPLTVKIKVGKAFGLPPTTGQIIHSNDDNNDNDNFFPADSFFDVFFRVELHPSIPQVPMPPRDVPPMPRGEVPQGLHDQLANPITPQQSRPDQGHPRDRLIACFENTIPLRMTATGISAIPPLGHPYFSQPGIPVPLNPCEGSPDLGLRVSLLHAFHLPGTNEDLKVEIKREVINIEEKLDELRVLVARTKVETIAAHIWVVKNKIETIDTHIWVVKNRIDGILLGKVFCDSLSELPPECEENFTAEVVEEKIMELGREIVMMEEEKGILLAELATLDEIKSNICVEEDIVDTDPNCANENG